MIVGVTALVWRAVGPILAQASTALPMCRVGLLLSVAFAAALAVQDVIIVADAGIDDAAGLLLAIASPSLNVLGIAATFGCHKDVEVTARNAERLLAAANRSHIPVFRGATNPYGSTEGLARDGSFVHGSDGMGDLTGQYGQECAPAEHHGVSASEFIAQSARKRPGEIALLSFSPLTNVALALAIEPRLPQLLKTVVAMGAAVRVAGNASPLGEANFVHDALAAQLVVHAFTKEGSCPLVLAPLDLTNPAVTSPTAIGAIRSRGGAAARLFADAWPTYQAAYCRLQGLCEGTPLHDAHPVAYLVSPELYTKVERVHLHVVVAGSHDDDTNGMSFVHVRGSRATQPEPGRQPVTLLLDVDQPKFEALLTETITSMV